MHYEVMFQKGHVVGARSLRIERVEAPSEKAAIAAARKVIGKDQLRGYYVYRVEEDEPDGDDGGEGRRSQWSGFYGDSGGEPD